LQRRHLANAIRVLAIDAVEAATCGHPGMPMGMADIAQMLWSDHLKFNPGDPKWADRDRFVLSNGHGSMLLYAVLHLTGYDLPLAEIKRFRQLHSKTPGHPEYGVTPGVETTTGPLGQGLGNAVGMALAERLLAAEFNRPGHAIVDHHTWAFCGDGCLMEGISHEAASLAGVLALEKLILVYDDNGISIDGHVGAWFADDTAGRFEAYGWRVLRDVDGHNAAAVDAAFNVANTACGKPTLICCKTVIGFGSPNKEGTAKAHGEALGVEEVALARKQLGWIYPPFVIPDEIRAAWNHEAAGRAAEAAWLELWKGYAKEYPQLAQELERRLKGELPVDWPAICTQALTMAAAAPTQGSRLSSQQVLNVIGPALPEFLGGSADLTGSNNTWNKASRVLTHDDPSGNYLHYGVREFGMSAIMNGVALHGGLIPYGGTFLTFSDYARNAVRLAALMHLRTIFVYTHDSIGLGEDGPTHQPIEHLPSLRLMPNLSLWRPADAVETAVAWRAAIEQVHKPTALVFSRQALPPLAKPAQAEAIARGGYVLIDCEGTPEALVISTGSEVFIAVEAVRTAQAQGKRVRLVSMPSCDVFDAQDALWRESVLPAAVTRRVAFEAAATGGWWKYVGTQGKVLGLDHYGASGKAADLYKNFGLTSAHVLALILELLA
jgi:transketolase